MTACSSESGSLCHCGSSLASDIQSGLTSEGTFYKKWDSLTKFEDCRIVTQQLCSEPSSFDLWDCGVGGKWDSKWPLHDTAEDVSCLARCTRDLAGSAGRNTASSTIAERQLTWRDQWSSALQQFWAKIWGRPKVRAAEPKPLARLASPGHTWQVGHIWGS